MEKERKIKYLNYFFAIALFGLFLFVVYQTGVTNRSSSSENLQLSPALSITNIQPANGATQYHVYKSTGLPTGSKYYNDRTYTITSTLPSYLSGKPAIIMSNNESLYKAISFTVNQPVRVYLAWDRREKLGKDWVNKTETISVTDPGVSRLNIYYKDYTFSSGGTITLPKRTIKSNYIVFVGILTVPTNLGFKSSYWKCGNGIEQVNGVGYDSNDFCIYSKGLQSRAKFSCPSSNGGLSKTSYNTVCTLPSAPVTSCQETLDGGKNYDILGTVKIGTETMTDYCTNQIFGLPMTTGPILAEYWCTASDGLANWEYHTCPNGCENGKCKAVCGNTRCEVGETCSNCASDCGTCSGTCGNGVCASGENCDADKGSCTDRICYTAPTCTNGCVDSLIANGLTDGTQCASPKVCNGAGSCITLSVGCNNNESCDPGETIQNCPNDCTSAVCNNDDTCDSDETVDSCPNDCHCGNLVCEDGTDGSTDLGEDYLNCVDDCDQGVLRLFCGDNKCAGNTTYIENYTECSGDCHCGDGKCNITIEDATDCPQDCSVLECNDDDTCDSSDGETTANCPNDCHCGNNECEADLGETKTTCPLDCDNSTSTPECGNNIEETGEDCDDGNTDDNDGCSSSCTTESSASCGDNSCAESESCTTCPGDCGRCPGPTEPNWTLLLIIFAVAVIVTGFIVFKILKKKKPKIGAPGPPVSGPPRYGSPPPSYPPRGPPPYGYPPRSPSPGYPPRSYPTNNFPLRR